MRRPQAGAGAPFLPTTSMDPSRGQHVLKAYKCALSSKAVQDDMKAVPKRMLNNLYSSLGKRMQQVIASGGGKPKY